MRKYLLYFAALVMLGACSTPKYTYYFDHQNYNAGRKQVATVVEPEITIDIEAPLLIDQSTLMASADEKPVRLAVKPVSPVKAEEAREAFAKKYKEMTKAERKEFRRELKNTMKEYMKARRQGDSVKAKEATAALDQDLKLAIIFGAVGLTLTLFGGVSEAFWILGVISIVVGVVFLIKWLVRQ